MMLCLFFNLTGLWLIYCSFQFCLLLVLCLCMHICACVCVYACGYAYVCVSHDFLFHFFCLFCLLFHFALIFFLIYPVDF